MKAKFDLKIILKDQVSMKFVKIPAGTFIMGCPAQENIYGDSQRQHEVTLYRPFYLGIYAVTQQQYETVMECNPSNCYFKGKSQPVIALWLEAMEFCRRASLLTGESFRLPTEVEWEYACRAGTTTTFNTGETISTSQANYNGFADGGIFRGKTIAVGSFPANAWGLHEMHGNVNEWCADRFVGVNAAGETIDSQYAVNEANFHVIRGGCWYDQPIFCRSDSRHWGGYGRT